MLVILNRMRSWKEYTDPHTQGGPSGAQHSLWHSYRQSVVRAHIFGNTPQYILCPISRAQHLNTSKQHKIVGRTWAVDSVV